MSKSSIVVIGSSNTDMVVKAARFPAPGETILGGDFLMTPGGKGANQAVAAARLGGKVVFVCKIGNDIFGNRSLDLFKGEGMDTSYIVLDNENPSGVALITVDTKGENNIVVASGANGAFLPDDVVNFQNALTQGSFVLIQLEIPVETVEYAAALACGKGAYVVLNPAPACKLPESIYKNLHIITPNEKEASMLAGLEVKDEKSAKKAAAILYGKGAKNVIITMGAKGALIYDGADFTCIKAQLVTAIDTTAAGDVFNGALVVALNEGYSLTEAAEFASKASAIAVTRLGAQVSAPYRKEIEDFGFVNP